MIEVKNHISGHIYGLRGMYATADIDISDGTPLVIGRSPKLANLVINDPQISKVHCVIEYNSEKQKYSFIDKSTNGTFLKDGKRLYPNRRYVFNAGDVFFLANIDNMFYFG